MPSDDKARTAGEPGGLPPPQRYLAIASVCCGTAMTVIDGGIVNVGLPTIARNLGVSASGVVSVVTVYQLVLVMLMLPFAGLGGRIGLKRTYQCGQAAFLIATLLCSIADSFEMLLAARVGQAIGAAAIMGISSALIRETYSASQLGRGLGINSLIVATSAAAAPALGGLVLGVASWPWLFAISIPFALASLIFGRSLPDSAARYTSFDWRGAIQCAAMFGLIVVGSESAVHGNSPTYSAVLVISGMLIGLRYIRYELKCPNPILPVDLLGQPIIVFSVIGAYTAFIASMIVLLSAPFRLTQNFGFSAWEVGAIVAPWPMTNMIVAPIASSLSDRVPAGLLGAIGMAISLIALGFLAFLPDDPTYFDLAWRMALCGSGFGLFMSPNARLIIGSVSRDRTAAAGGLVSTVRLLGQTTGATTVALLLKLDVGADRIPTLVAAGFALVAGACSLARFRPALRSLETDETDSY